MTARKKTRGARQNEAIMRWTTAAQCAPDVSPRELLERWRGSGDIAARDLLVALHVPLVLRMIRRYAVGRRNPEDVLQAGILGIVHAANVYDLAYAGPFGAYAALWVRAAVLDCAKRGRVVRSDTDRLGRTVFNRAGRAVRALQRDGIDATATAIAERVAADEGLPVARVGRALSALASPVALDAPLHDDDDGGPRQRYDTIAAPAPDLDELYDEQTRRARLLAALERLPERARVIIEARYLRDEPVPLRDLGEQIGLSGERVRQIERDAIAELREQLTG